MARRGMGHSTFHDLLDNQVEDRDGVPMGRVADVKGEWRPDGRLVLTALLLGPQALIGRVATRLEPLARFVFRDRLEYEIPIREVVEMGVTVRLRGRAADYRVGHRAEMWIARHVLRYLSLFRY